MNVRYKKYCFIIVLFYIGTLWSWLQYRVLGFFSNWDEILSLLFIPLFLHNIYNKKSLSDLKIWAGIMAFVLFGLLGNAVNEYTGISNAISDCFLNIKFFMLCYAVYYLFRGWEWRLFSIKIKKSLNFLSIALLGLVFADRMFKIFPVFEVRFGIASEELFFSHPTFCAAAFFYLLMLRVLFIEARKKFDNVIDAGICLTILLTLRFKAIAVILIVFALIIFTKYKSIRCFKWIIIGMCILAIVLISYEQIYGYFLSPYASKFARGALLITSIELLKVYFPLGTGFATFGSYLSGVYYSPIYSIFHINNVPGITVNEYNAITDQYWPMIAGQTGILGLIAMLSTWFFLYKKIKEFNNKSVEQFIVGYSCFAYILVSSTSESAICNPACMPFAIVLGLLFAQFYNVEKGYEK